MMHYHFDPDPKRKGRNKFIGSSTQPFCRPIPLPETIESLRKVLTWGMIPDSAPYNHHEIADWCRVTCSNLRNKSDEARPQLLVDVAHDVDCQWELFLANTYSLPELQKLDYTKVRLPVEWFSDWLKQLA
jgi:hypothetical protein